MGFMKKFAGLFIGDDIDDDEDELNEEETESIEDDDTAIEEEAHTEKEIPRTAPKSVELKVVRLASYDSEIRKVADYLKSKKTVVLIIEGASAEATRRILDFLVGVTYAIGGQLKHISSETYIVTAGNVAISSEQMQQAAEMGSEPEPPSPKNIIDEF